MVRSLSGKRFVWTSPSMRRMSGCLWETNEFAPWKRFMKISTLSCLKPFPRFPNATVCGRPCNSGGLSLESCRKQRVGSLLPDWWQNLSGGSSFRRIAHGTRPAGHPVSSLTFKNRAWGFELRESASDGLLAAAGSRGFRVEPFREKRNCASG